MKIKTTDGSYCKIKDIKITGLKAEITLLVYSSIPQTSVALNNRTNRVFQFFIEDLPSRDINLLSNNYYWIDRNNNYDTHSNNIDINMYKEVILDVDITNNNTALMQDSSWLRKCKIIIVDRTTNTDERAWESETLNLISQLIELPTIERLRISQDKSHNTSIAFNLNYESQEDFNYTNSNLITVLRVKSIATGEVIESSEDIDQTITPDEHSNISYTFLHKYNSPVLVEIIIKNLKGSVLLAHSKFFNPSYSLSRMAQKLNRSLYNIVAVGKISKGELLPVKSINAK